MELDPFHFLCSSNAFYVPKGGCILLVINFHAVPVFFRLFNVFITGTSISSWSKVGLLLREWISAFLSSVFVTVLSFTVNHEHRDSTR